MQVVSFELEILSPLVLTSLSGDENTVSTEKFISGTSLLGALASAYISEKNLGLQAHKDANFSEWFLSGKLQFGNIYPLGKDENGKHILSSTPIFFQHEKGDEDNYYNLFVNRETGKSYKSKEGLSIVKDEREIHFPSLKTKYNFHHERNYRTGISEEGKIFTYESLEKGYVFSGTFSGEENSLKSFLDWLKTERILYIGRSKNSQYGKVKIENIAPKENKSLEIEDNFILTLNSDLILYNENGFPTTDVQYLLKYFTGCELVRAEREGEKLQISAIVKSKAINGFHGAWKLRKNTDISFQAGSSFYLKILDNSNKPETGKQIQSLLQSGIGERTHEGFGKFQIFPEYISNLSKEENTIHTLTVYEETQLIQIKDSKEVKELIESVYRTELKKLVQKKVHLDVEKLKVKNTKGSFVSHFLSFLNKDTGRFEYKDHKAKGNPNIKELHRALERNVNRLSIGGEFLFDYFKDVYKELTPDSLIAKESSLEHLKNDYPFLKNSSLERELNFTYFRAFVNALRKKIKKENQNRGGIK
jgi:CRISPR-associated protein Csx10